MSATHRHTCDQLATCQGRTPRCDGCNAIRPGPAMRTPAQLIAHIEQLEVDEMNHQARRTQLRVVQAINEAERAMIPPSFDAEAAALEAADLQAREDAERQQSQEHSNRRKAVRAITTPGTPSEGWDSAKRLGVINRAPLTAEAYLLDRSMLKPRPATQTNSRTHSEASACSFGDCQRDPLCRGHCPDKPTAEALDFGTATCEDKPSYAADARLANQIETGLLWMVGVVIVFVVVLAYSLLS